MIARLAIYYTTRTVQSIVDLKMNPQTWLRAKRVLVPPGQTEVRIEFTLPLIASALIIEYQDFYERDSSHIASHADSLSTSAANPAGNNGSSGSSSVSSNALLQCPRCSALVAAHPGVCNTCGENVFQCHKCRAINYDERDPFLCNSCGFCKFAKFEFTVVGRVYCAADPVECDEDRKQTLQSIGVLLDRADKVYTILAQQFRPTLESMLMRCAEQNSLERYTLPMQTATTVTPTTTTPPSATTVTNPATLDFSNLLLANSNNSSNSGGVLGFRLTPLTVLSNNNSAGITANVNTTAAPVNSSQTRQPTATATNATTVTSSTITTAATKLTQSVVQKYAVECKAKFDELAKLVIKLNLCRKELREYDKQFKAPPPLETVVVNLPRSIAASRKNSTSLASAAGSGGLSLVEQILLTRQTTRSSICGGKTTGVQNSSGCYGCQLASVEYCVTLFRAMLCAESSLAALVRGELCAQGVLDDLVNFNMKFNRITPVITTTVTTTPTAATVPTSTAATNPAVSTNTATTTSTATTAAATATTNNSNLSQVQLAQRIYDRDLVNLIYALVRDNADGSARFERLLLDKLELMLASQNTHSVMNNPLQNELVLLGSLVVRPQQEDTCWEQRLRLVIHILLRSLNAAVPSSSTNSKTTKQTASPLLIEHLTLPCLRMLAHICKTTTNIPLLTQLATSSTLRQINNRAGLNKQSALNRCFYSEPADATSFAPSLPPPQLPSSSSSACVPKLVELDVNQFMQQQRTVTTSSSYYDKWLGLFNSGKFSSANEDSAADSLLIIGQMKLKYFAAWRKYTHKKRKQRQLKQQQQQQEQATNQTIQQQSILVTKPKLETPSSSNVPTQQLLSSQSSSSSGSNSNLNVAGPAIAITKNSAEAETSLTPKTTLTTATNTASGKPNVASALTNSFEYKYDLKLKWLRACLFCPSSKSVRQLTCQLIQSLFTFYSQLPQQNVLSFVGGDSANINAEYAQYNARKLQIAELLCDLLEDCCNSNNASVGDACLDYLTLFKQVIADKDCKYRLVLRLNILHKLELLLHREIKLIDDLERLSELSTTTHIPACNLNLGYSTKMLTELLALFLKEQNIKNKFKHRLVATVLNSYLSLKRLMFQRTRLIDDAQEKLLGCLEQMTSGTELEQRKFMHICIQTVCNFDLDDLVTPVFIFERLCQIIYPDETVDNKEFLLILEKDPNQEDYLQGRMLGNPYSSAEPGLGPLMRNVKNKICMDCELVALLDDDNGMELLVNNKIISLDLSVKDVYKKVNILFLTFFLGIYYTINYLFS